jgi:pimeloyl-ACP methyl ester carboxylesterase
VLFVRGSTCDSNNWIFQFAPFTEHHRVIAPDLRGHGHSSTPNSGYGPRVFTSDLTELFRRLDVAPVVAVGHSLRGLIVAALAIEHPDVVRATITVDPGYCIDEPTATLLMKLASALDSPANSGVVGNLFANSAPSRPIINLSSIGILSSRTFCLRRRVRDTASSTRLLPANRSRSA